MLAFERVGDRRAEAGRGARSAFWVAAAVGFATALGATTLGAAATARADVPEASLSVQGPLPAGAPVVVRFAGLPAGQHAWIAVAPEAYGEAAYDEWVEVGDKSAGTVAFRGQAPGVYAIRAFGESPERHVIAEITVTIPRRHDAAPVALMME